MEQSAARGDHRFDAVYFERLEVHGSRYGAVLNVSVQGINARQRRASHRD
jgi:hypothetical protein